MSVHSLMHVKYFLVNFRKFPAADVEYTVKLKIDGVEVPDANLCPSGSKHCKFTVSSFYVRLQNVDNAKYDQ